MTDLLSFTAREPTLSLAFNYASLLTNNSYFLEGMNAEAPKPIPEHFQGLEDRVAAYADGVAGSGWLWVSVIALRQDFSTLRRVADCGTRRSLIALGLHSWAT